MISYYQLWPKTIDQWHIFPHIAKYWLIFPWLLCCNCDLPWRVVMQAAVGTSEGKKEENKTTSSDSFHLLSSTDDITVSWNIKKPGFCSLTYIRKGVENILCFSMSEEPMVFIRLCKYVFVWGEVEGNTLGEQPLGCLSNFAWDCALTVNLLFHPSFRFWNG